MPVRSADLEPYIGLGYLSRLFKLMAVVLLILLLSEVVTGLIAQGTAAIPRSSAKSAGSIVLAGLLWGSGDLALLLIDIGHDVQSDANSARPTGAARGASYRKRDPATFVERAPAASTSALTATQRRYAQLPSRIGHTA